MCRPTPRRHRMPHGCHKPSARHTPWEGHNDDRCLKEQSLLGPATRGREARRHTPPRLPGVLRLAAPRQERGPTTPMCAGVRCAHGLRLYMPTQSALSCGTLDLATQLVNAPVRVIACLRSSLILLLFGLSRTGFVSSPLACGRKCGRPTHCQLPQTPNSLATTSSLHCCLVGRPVDTSRPEVGSGVRSSTPQTGAHSLHSGHVSFSRSVSGAVAPSGLQ